MTISAKQWQTFTRRLAAINTAAGAKMRQYIDRYGLADADALIRYAYALVTKYGEASASLAADMYDAIAALSGVSLPPAAAAPTAAYGDTAAAMYATAASGSPEQVTAAVERLTKLPGADTMLQNAIRDKAEFAWVPSGDTCAFCLAIASRGWQRASQKAMKGGHAEHIHGNCDCMYAIRHDSYTEVAGYDDGARYKAMYDDAEGRSSKDKINAMRRKFYAQKAEEINEQKRSAYEKRRERESSTAEEGDAGTP